MILELDTSLLNKYNISINQLVFISLVLNDNQPNNQDIQELLSRVNEEEIQELIQRNIVVVNISDNNQIYSPSEELLKSIKKIEKVCSMSSMKYFQFMLQGLMVQKAF